MSSAARPALRFCHVAHCLLACALLSGPAAASEEALEREHLAAAIRQLNLLDTLSSPPASSLPGTRYHFDYRRLAEDIQRIRAGIQDYLTPQRAQPRDLSQIAETYRLDAPAQVTP